MSSLLIIGGSGFVGKSILDYYSRGYLNNISKIIILSRNASDLILYYPDLVNNNKVELINSDIRTCKVIPYADFVIHAAATTDASRYTANPNEELNNLLLSIENYCSLAKIFHKNSKILYISSGAVYGNQPITISKISEQYSIKNTVNDMVSNKIPYAIAKRKSECIFSGLSKYGLNLSIARGYTFVGEHLPLDKHFAIGNFLLNGLLGKPIIVNANKFIYRSYMYSDDLVEWLMRILHFSSHKCPIYNIGSNEVILIDELAYKIAFKLGVDVHVLNKDRVEIDRYIPCIDKALNNGLRVKYDLDKSINKTIERLKITFKS